MSHAAVLLIQEEGDNLEDMLAPYNEQPEDGSEYIEFSAEFTDDEAKDRLLEINEEIRKENKEKAKDPKRKKEKPHHLYNTVDAAMEDRECLVHNDDEGAWGYNSNPNARWDWYVTGGRWTGMLKLKDPKCKEGYTGSPGLMTNAPEAGHVDSAFIKDIDEQCLKSLTCFAVLSSKHGWQESGELGWFGCSNTDPDTATLPSSIKQDDIDNTLKPEFNMYKQEYLDKIESLLKAHYDENKSLKLWIRNKNKLNEDILKYDFFTYLGWSERFYEEYIQKLDPDTRITVVDYHI